MLNQSALYHCVIAQCQGFAMTFGFLLEYIGLQIAYLWAFLSNCSHMGILTVLRIHW